MSESATQSYSTGDLPERYRYLAQQKNERQIPLESTALSPIRGEYIATTVRGLGVRAGGSDLGSHKIV